MKLLLDRKWKKDTYTIGKLYINGMFFCNTIEDKDRGLKQTMSLTEIQKKKVYAKTAIPTGIYKVTLNVVSPKFSKKEFYYNNANKGRVPRLLNVPGFDGILIHVGSTADNSAGCIIVGENKIKGQVVNSKETFIQLYKHLMEANNKGEKITIEIR